MTKPLGYYTNYIPGKETLLATLQDNYGAASLENQQARKAGYSYCSSITHWLSTRR
ncbi:hypothetical protein [Nostoc sp. ChiQUE01b]|uniref:hypothetical protein n=1 Tax=Nostoc sp. ChiQUE01b TaxID=3075376 RepID=UPI002AD4E67A|nr:hypothetical protein [Nostoc sp. ChiQUE01b]